MSATPLASMAFVRLFRLWAAARVAGENPLPHMNDAIGLFAPAPELAVACASLFDLVEANLGRRLVPECCCGREMSRDELALLGVLRHAPEAGLPLTRAAIPHGLPGAVRWAAFAVRRALVRSFDDAFERETVDEAMPERCPFSARSGGAEQVRVVNEALHCC